MTRICLGNRSLGINVKREREEEINSISTHDDISKLFDMISTPGMPAAPEWYHTASDSYEISNGRQSSTATDDELGLELQNLASSLSVAPSEHDWNVGSCSWSNMPRIC
ncbi:uncharacterized protein A4U43_C03F11790 [Asparagus officinalis]|uniref:Uncharacterized protein n=1 Tax=Asparagus officinalis TaxID=4686 RepID=A0A5P1F9W0_ASPOF|nr:uncharacterized protein A4U43_C03F11790 [Asparagus officinalis]